MADLNVNSIGDAAGGNTATINSYTPTESNMAGRNRIINGDMRIDARNAGASVSISAPSYTLDRMYSLASGGGVYTVQQSSTVPSSTGFRNSAAYTVTTADSSIAAGDYYCFDQRIEGYNVSDLNFGNSGATPFTVSFWVRSSITGTYAVSFFNAAADRSYVTTYTVNAANTWEQKTITVTPDTSGTWLTTNGIGVVVRFGLGIGSTYTTSTLNAWQAGLYFNANTATNWISTNGATFYITGVQLEAGSVATPFEHRQYGQELALCQRYYYKWVSTATSEPIGTGFASGTTASFVFVPFPVTMRVRPAALENTGTASNYRFVRAGATTITCSAAPIYSNSSTVNGQMLVYVASGLTTGEGLIMQSNATGAFLAWSAEL